MLMRSWSERTKLLEMGTTSWREASYLLLMITGLCIIRITGQNLLEISEYDDVGLGEKLRQAEVAG